MRNISAVVAEMGGVTLSAYSPAPQVGSGVRARIVAILKDHPIFRDLLSQRFSSDIHAPVDRADLQKQLRLLRQYLDLFEGQIAGIGHNNPPEQIAPTAPHHNEVRQAKADVDTISAELAKSSPDLENAQTSLRRLKHFGLKVALWIGERTTKFVDAALVTAAPIAVATATDFLPVLIEVIRGLGKLIGQP
jgi:hypothetical protein